MHYCLLETTFHSHPKRIISSWHDVKEIIKTDIQTDSLRIRTKKDIQAKISNDDLGAMFELALQSYLNNFFTEPVFNRPSSRSSAAAAAAGQPDLLDASGLLAVNCKFFLGDRSAYVLHCSPEYRFADPWVAFFNRRLGLLFQPNPNRREYLDFSAEKGVSVEDFIGYVVEKYCVELKSNVTSDTSED